MEKKKFVENWQSLNFAIFFKFSSVFRNHWEKLIGQYLRSKTYPAVVGRITFSRKRVDTHKKHAHKLIRFTQNLKCIQQ